MKDLFSENTNVLLFACHVGNLENRGDQILKSLASIWGVTVYGNQSLTTSAIDMFRGGDVSYAKWLSVWESKADRAEAKNLTRAVNCYGRWTYAVPGRKKVDTIIPPEQFAIKDGDFIFKCPQVREVPLSEDFPWVSIR